MRTFSTLHFVLSLATLLMLVSCTKDNAMQEAEQELDISVCDEGFGFATRAELNGYNTTFATGDACGFFVIRGSKIIHRNVKLTRASNGGWELEKTVRAKASDGFFIYWPYDSNKSGKFHRSSGDKATSESSDKDFFPRGLIGTPPSDQRILESFIKYDWMTAKASVTVESSKINLTFKMNHRNALAVIVDNATNKEKDIKIEFNQYKPYQNGSNYYYITTPTTDISSFYVTATRTNGNYGQDFKLDLSGIAEGAYKTFNITYQNGAKP